VLIAARRPLRAATDIAFGSLAAAAVGRGAAGKASQHL